MNVLIIGFGSIGKRHYEVLSNFNEIKNVDIVTKQNLIDKNTYFSLKDIKDINNYDYFIIASETYKHLEQLEYLDSKVNNKIIFCEKPLFDVYQSLKIINNKVFIGYVLRFHPLMQYLKESLKHEKVISANINCGQYLPTWRVNTNYRESYSAKKEKGGGVLLDLSHEIDYAQWLFGNIKELKSYQLKISDLEINSDDIMTFIGKTDKNVVINLSLDYISKITYRKILIHTVENTYELDFIKNELKKVGKNKLEEILKFNNMYRNYMFESMHKDILDNKIYACDYSEGLEVMKIISVIQEQNK